MRGVTLVLVAALLLGGLAWFVAGTEDDPGPVLGAWAEEAGLAPSRPPAELDGAAPARPDAPLADAAAATPADGERASLAAEVTGLAVVGRVLEELGRAPVPGAELRLVSGDLEVRGESDEQGAFALDWPHPSTPALLVTHPRYVDLVRPLELFLAEADPDVVPGDGAAGAALPEQELLLASSGAITGRADPLARGAAQEGMPVLLWSYRDGRYRGEPTARTELDRTYRFRFDDLDPGAYMVGVVDERSPMAFESGLVVDPGGVTEVVLPLERGFALRGRVVRRGATTSPIEGARVRYQPEVQGVRDGVEELARAEVVTGSDGSFRFEGLPAGQVDLWVETPWGGHLRERVSVLESRDEREVLLRVSMPARLAGRVLDADGRPAANAWVACTRRDVSRRHDWSDPAALPVDDSSLLRVRSDGQGRFDLGEVAARSELVVVAWPEEGGPLATSARVTLDESESRADLELTLPGSGAIGGRALDGAGEPLEGVLVSVSTVLRVGRVHTAEVRTDVEGRFGITGLPAGDVQVRAELEGYRDARSRGLVDGEDLELVLERERVVTGHVLDERGNAVASAWVRATKVEEGQEETRNRWRRSESRTSGTDDYGRFELDDLTEGTWDVRPQAGGYRSLDSVRIELPADEGARLQLRMEAEEVLESGTVVGELVVEASGDPVPGLRFDNLRDGTVRLSGTRFKITGVRPGNLRLVAQSEGFERIDYPLVEVPPGGEVDLGRLTVRRDTRVSVRVLGADGKPLADARVRLLPQKAEDGGRPHPTGRIDLGFDGRRQRYRRGGVPRYRWELVVQHRGHKTHRQTFVPDLGEHEVTVRLEAL